MSIEKIGKAEDFSVLGRNVLKLLKSRHITQKRFAVEVGVRANSFNDILKGRVKPGKSLMILIALKLNVSVENLLGGEITEEEERYGSQLRIKRDSLRMALEDYVEHATKTQIIHLEKYLTLIDDRKARSSKGEKTVKSVDEDDPSSYELKADD